MQGASRRRTAWSRRSGSHAYQDHDEVLIDDERSRVQARFRQAGGKLSARSALSFVMEVFDSTIEQEDYAAAETTQRAAESGLLDFLVFGRNEPALHHIHDTYRTALGMPPLEPFEG